MHIHVCICKSSIVQYNSYLFENGDLPQKLQPFLECMNFLVLFGCGPRGDRELCGEVQPNEPIKWETTWLFKFFDLVFTTFLI